MQLHLHTTINHETSAQISSISLARWLAGSVYIYVLYSSEALVAASGLFVESEV